jgi:hypothetical protein
LMIEQTASCGWQGVRANNPPITHHHERSE